ncbi:MAG: putative HTH-type transcriptional regulator YusO [Syntrophaceae bacterium PtaU1.Bin231]|nr:MAG: putative HTH-type transcriptional regulator YusO [Syntrophaceae bacterium PtaU1.Bin231]
MTDKDRVIAEIADDLRRVFQAVHSYTRRAKKASGLTSPQLWAIKMIADSGPIRVSDLSRKMYLHPATVIGILDRLMRLGLIRKTRSRKDRRVVHATLTAEGKKIVEQSPQVAQGMIVSGLEVLSVQRLETIAESMREMAAILQAQELPPKMLLSPEVNIPLDVPGQG